MAKLWTIIKREYIERVRTKWFIIATIFGPIFFGAMIIIPAVMAKRTKSTTEFTNTRILDATNTGFGQRIADVMREVAREQTRDFQSTGREVGKLVAADYVCFTTVTSTSISRTPIVWRASGRKPARRRC